jgi:hypothetical protein
MYLLCIDEGIVQDLVGRNLMCIVPCRRICVLYVTQDEQYSTKTFDLVL